MRRLLQDSLPQIIGGLVVAAILAGVGLLYRQLGFWVTGSIVAGTLIIGSSVWFLYLLRRRNERRTDQWEGRTQHSTALANSDVIGRFYFTREKVVARVHPDFEPSFSSEFTSAFEELNNKKRSKGLQGYYLGRRFRLILPPRISNHGIRLDLCPLNYGFVALMKDSDSASDIKRKIPDHIAKFPKPLPKTLVSSDPYFNIHSCNLLGTVTCLITSDGFVHLRKRGRSVLTGESSWDMAVSGHPRPQDINNNHIDVGQTVQREAEQEVGTVNGEIAQIAFTGLHRNKKSGDVDILALWVIEDKVDKYTELLASKRSGKKAKVFRTSVKAREAYVWDTQNLLVPFNGPAILQALREEGIGLEDFLPESLVCLELALISQNQPHLGIEL